MTASKHGGDQDTSLPWRREMHFQHQSSRLLSSKKVRAVIQRLSFGAQEHRLVLGYVQEFGKQEAVQ